MIGTFSQGFLATAWAVENPVSNERNIYLEKYPALERVFETGNAFRASIAATHWKERSAAAWRVEDISENQAPISGTGVSDGDSTSVRGVIRCVLRAMEVVPSGSTLTIYSNLEHVVDGVNRLLPDWKRAGWKSKEGRLKNDDLWKMIDDLWTQKNLTVTAVQAKAGSARMAEIEELKERARQLLHHQAAAE